MRRHAVLRALVLLLLTPLVPGGNTGINGQGFSVESAAQFPMSPGEFPMMLPPGRKAKTGTGRLRGRVVAADTGSIVRRAQVRVSSPDIGTKTAFTDGQGRYEFRDLPAGQFNVSVSKSGFVTMRYGQTRPFEPGRPIDLVDAQVMEKADVALPRGSVVSGRVLDEFGEPVADATVSAMRKEYSMGKRRLSPSGRGSTTNDLGQFRLFGLPPGEYYVSATVRSFESMVMDMMGGGAGGPTGSNNNSGYAASYYPGTPNPGEAQRISLAVGQEVANADIQMQPVRLARISGSAFSSDGKPMSGAMVMLMPTMKDAMQFMPGGTSQTDKDGSFTLSGVAPGEYTVQVQSLAAIMKMATEAMKAVGGDADTAAPPAQVMEREFAIGAVTIGGDDVTGLIINGARGARARGRVVFEGGAPPQNLTSLRLIASPTDFDMVSVTASAFGMAAVKANGTFEIDGLVGGRVFRFMEWPAGWFLKRVSHDNDDITDKGYAFKPGEEVEGFDIVMTTRSQPVSGTVTNEKGEPAKNYTVVVFPEDPQQWMATTSRSHASSRPDQQGRFRIAELPPGAYLAIAVEYVAEGEWMDPEWLERAAKKATAFTLTEGAAKTLNLKLAGS